MAGRGSLLGQATEAREGPALQLRLGLLITAQGGAHDGQLSRAQGQDAGFAPLTEGQGGGGMGWTLGAMAGGFAAPAAQDNEGPAQEPRGGGSFDRLRFRHRHRMVNLLVITLTDIGAESSVERKR
jgi:hypothetical protein